MQIILLEKIGKLGNLGDIVNVKNGYARNYLIPQGKAKRATKASIEEFNAKRAELEAKQAKVLEEAKTQKEKLDVKTFSIKQKSGVDGKLFGSVTNIDICSLINESEGLNLHKSQIRIPDGLIKNIGEYDIEVNLHHEVVASIKLLVETLVD